MFAPRSSGGEIKSFYSVSGINRNGILTSAVNIIMILPERKTESRNAILIGGN